MAPLAKRSFDCRESSHRSINPGPLALVAGPSFRTNNKQQRSWQIAAKHSREQPAVRVSLGLLIHLTLLPDETDIRSGPFVH